MFLVLIQKKIGKHIHHQPDTWLRGTVDYYIAVPAVPVLSEWARKSKMAAVAGKVPRIKLGSEGLEVSKQGLGCMGMSSNYGPPKPEPDMIKLIHHAIDSGVTFLDTSDVYGPHTNEILIGKVNLIFPGSMSFWTMFLIWICTYFNDFMKNNSCYEVLSIFFVNYFRIWEYRVIYYYFFG